jgi:glycosyltransferase involved in cell wall biosynthesis
VKRLSVVQVIYGGLGGAENMVVALAKALHATGVQSSVLCLHDDAYVDYIRRVGLRVEVVPVRSRFDFPSILTLYAYFRRGRFDVVHTHLSRAMLMGNVAARLSRTPAVVTTFHSRVYLGRNGIREWSYGKIEGLLGRFCTDRCAAYAEPVRADSIGIRGIPAGRIVTIHNGLDINAFRPPGAPAERHQSRRELGLEPGDFVIGAVGRLAAEKGHTHLITATARVARELPSARLVIVGAGPLRNALESMAAREGVRERVLFAGDLRADSGVYGTMDVFVYPSIKGVFGIAVLEAMACGIPVVASGQEGTDELVNDGQNGLLVPPGDERAIAEAVLRVSRDPDLRRRLGAAGRNTVALGFTDTGMARQYRSLYESLLGRRCGHRRPALRM